MKPLGSGYLIACAVLHVAAGVGHAATVSVCTEAALRAALAAGGTVTLGCSGTITLSSPLVITGAVVLDATGRNVSLSGGSVVRLFQVSSNASLTISNLTLINGGSTNGGAVLNEGTLFAAGCVFSNNAATGINTSFSMPAVPGSEGQGGAVWNTGFAAFHQCAFLANSATGGRGLAYRGTNVVAASWDGHGGAIYNGGWLMLSNSTLSLNSARARDFGSGDSKLGGSAWGGAIFNGHEARIWASTLEGNWAIGGAWGGPGTGPGTTGGNAYGGGICSTGLLLALTNCTLVANQAQGAPKVSFSAEGISYGGGLYGFGGTQTVSYCTLASNLTGTLYGYGGGIAAGPATLLTHSIIAYGSTLSANVTGPFTDLGHNLSSDLASGFYRATSMNGVDPRLGPLADNLGPTPTMSLLAGSPAIDTGSSVPDVASDQRGMPRPSGSWADIGAFEGSLIAPHVTVGFSNNQVLAGAPVLLAIAVSNVNSIPLNIAITNRVSAGFKIGSGSVPYSDCGAEFSAPPGADTFVARAVVPPGQNCVLRVPLVSDLVGVRSNVFTQLMCEQTGVLIVTGSPPVIVSGRPAGRTDTVTGVGFSSATLRGVLNPGGAPTAYWFEYGSSPAMGQTTGIQVLPGGIDAVPVFANISGLASSTDFYFRLAATNQFGAFGSEPGTFFTLGEVRICDDAHLRANLAVGGTIRIRCNGTIQVSNTFVVAANTVLDATAQQVVLSGRGSNGLFHVPPGLNLRLSNLTLANGRATNGGAVFNQGTFEAVGCIFTNNQAVGLTAAAGEGGAVWNGATATLRECGFQGNSALGGAGFSMPGHGLPGTGGAVCNHGSLIVSGCTFTANNSRGGVGSTALSFPPGPGSGGPGQGAGLYNAQSATVLNSTFSANTSSGGTGGPGSLSTAGGNGGPGFGGAVFNIGTLAATNCTLHANQAVGGPGVFGRLGHGRNGQGFGGGVMQSGGSATFAFCTFAANASTNGGGALHSLSNAAVRLTHSILAHGAHGGNANGAVEDLGYNLSSDASVSFTNIGSVILTDPKIGPLANNGGPTPTLALLAGSPAIDAGAGTAEAATDQRGYLRPAGARNDIGAFEGSLGPLTGALSILPGATNVGRIVWLELMISNLNNSSFSNCRLTNSLSAHLGVGPGPPVLAGFNGTVTAPTGGSTIILSGFSLEPGGSCTVRLPITAGAVGIGVSTVAGLDSDQLGRQPISLAASLIVSGPPDGRTEAASDAGFTSATLHGAINPGGAATTAWFEYGTTAAFGQTTPPVLLPAGFGELPVSAALPGLPDSTDFFYRVAASNEAGVFLGSTRSFFTLGEVTVCDEAHLRANLARGGAIRIVCDGVIALSNTLTISIDTEIDATGYQVALGGNDAVRVLDVAAGASVALRELTITRGRSTHGAGIRNAGTLLLDRCVLTANQAVGTDGLRGPNGASAPSHPPAPPMNGQPGGFGGDGGAAQGGALFNSGMCVAQWTTFSSNRVTGGTGGDGGRAGSPNTPGAVIIPGGFGGTGGTGAGGAIFNNGTLRISNGCVFGNRAKGGPGGVGGQNFGFGFNVGGPGGASLGAGIRNEHELMMINVTVTANEAVGGDAGGSNGSPPANGGNGIGGGISAGGLVRMTNCTIAANRALGGKRATNSPPYQTTSTNGIGLGGGLATTGAVVVLKNVLLAHAPSNANCFGPVTDAGNNISSDSSCPFTAATSRATLDPFLAPLADNGGPTPTMSLLPFSPAIDAADPTACSPSDQRGRPRPALGGCDVGAFETQPDFFGLRSIQRLDPQTCRLKGIGQPGAGFRVLASDNLVQWAPAGSGTIGVDGLFEIDVTVDGTGELFFRTVSP